MKIEKINEGKGITLIALVITIIVLLILAGVALSLVVGEDGITNRAVIAGKTQNIAGAKEQLELDIANYGAEFYQAKYVNGNLPTGVNTVHDFILSKYTDGAEIEYADNFKLKRTGNTLTLTSNIASDGETTATATIEEDGKVTWGAISYGGDPVVNETPIEKSPEKEDSFVGYYADIDNDGDVDGIIYADMITGNTKSGRWNNYVWSDYNVTKITDTSTVKDYVFSSKTYEGQTEAGKYKANDGFREKEVLVPATNTSGLDRFYVMTLQDFTNNSKDNFYWYKEASGKFDRDVAASANDFGKGKENTIKMLDDWNNKTSTYGAQTTSGDYIDLWGAIQDGQYDLVQATGDSSKKWFIPSKSEWSAFGEELGITTSNYPGRGLGSWYWSSSQGSSSNAWGANFDYCYMYNGYVGNGYAVRLSATF